MKMDFSANQHNRNSEENYFRKCCIILWNNMFFLLLGNLLFVIFCTPSFILFFTGDIVLFLWTSCLSAIPGFSGLLYFVAKIIQEGNSSLKNFFSGFLHFYGRSAMFGIVWVLSLLGILNTLQVHQKITIGIIGLMVLVFVIFLFVTTLLAQAFPLMALKPRITLRTLLSCALFLASKYRVQTAGIILFGFLCILVIWWSKLSLIFILPAIWAVFACELTARLLTALEMPE